MPQIWGIGGDIGVSDIVAASNNAKLSLDLHSRFMGEELP